MCVALSLRVKKVSGVTARMEDGRTIRLGPLESVQAGDYLEVYADLALGKVDPQETQSIRKARQGEEL